MAVEQLVPLDDLSAVEDGLASQDNVLAGRAASGLTAR
jgi:hypothetical protein